MIFKTEIIFFSGLAIFQDFHMVDRFIKITRTAVRPNTFECPMLRFGPQERRSRHRSYLRARQTTTSIPRFHRPISLHTRVCTCLHKTCFPTWKITDITSKCSKSRIVFPAEVQDTATSFQDQRYHRYFILGYFVLERYRISIFYM